MSGKKYLFIIIILFLNNNVQSKEFNNKVMVLIDNTIITELDIKKEVSLNAFLQKKEELNNLLYLKKEAIENLIDRKIKNIEIDFYKIDINEKEVDNSLYLYLKDKKISIDDLEKFLKNNELEDDYLRNVVKTDLRWGKLIRQMYENRINVNLTEVIKQLDHEKNNTTDKENAKNQLINIEQNKILNKFSITHLEKSKKKYLIKFL